MPSHIHPLPRDSPHVQRVLGIILAPELCLLFRARNRRHAFVTNRMLAWYREGVNPQSRLPYLATYLGHKDINSTLVYLTITQELLQHASERFHAFAAGALQISAGAKP